MQKFSRIFFLIAFLAIIFVPGISLAATNPNCNLGANGTTLCNPLPYDNFIDFNAQIVKFILGAVATVATVTIVQGGFLIVMAQGNEEELTAARHRIVWALVGLVIALLAYTFVAVILTALTDTSSPAGSGTTSSTTK